MMSVYLGKILLVIVVVPVIISLACFKIGYGHETAVSESGVSGVISCQIDAAVSRVEKNVRLYLRGIS